MTFIPKYVLSAIRSMERRAQVCVCQSIRLGCLLLTLLCGTVTAFAQDASPTTPTVEKSDAKRRVDQTSPGATTTLPADATSSDSIVRAATEPVGSKAAVASSPHGLHGEFSPWGMFLAADIVVKAVMVGLAAASFFVWTVWVAKSMQIWRQRQRLRRDLLILSGKPSIETASAVLSERRSLAFAMIAAVNDERRVTGGYFRSGLLDRVSSRLGEIEMQATREMRSGMSFLATVSATGPFIGLFGTVWGIMNSFIGIAKSQTTNLAVVAPGIAEALLATAIGLIAAIPAVILYNNLGKGIGHFKRLARETRGEVERIVSRELDGPMDWHRFPALASSASE